jgi:hypothetical protein
MKKQLARLLAMALAVALLAAALPLAVSAAPKYRLRSLTVVDVAFTPSVRATTYAYSAVVPNATRRVRVRASVSFSRADEEAGAYIDINGEKAPDSGQGINVDLAEGFNTISVKVYEAEAAAEYSEYTIEIDRLERGETPISISTANLPEGVVGRRYSARIQASGTGTRTYYIDNDLPDGLELDEETGRITGTPQNGSTGLYRFNATVESSDTNTAARKAFSIRIHPRGTDISDDDDTSSSSSQSSSSSAPAATKPAAPTVSGTSQAGIINTVQSRINSTAAGGMASVRYRNLGTVELTTLQTISRAAGSRTLRLGSERQYDNNTKTESRVTIDPKASTKTVSLLSSTTISSDNCRNVTALMNRYYSNQVSVIRLDQKGAYGQTAAVYAKLDNASLYTAPLRFYTYDSATNRLDAFNTSYSVSRDGYITFTTAVGNYIVVSNGALKRR